MFMEPTITGVPTGFSGCIMDNGSIQKCAEKEPVDNIQFSTTDQNILHLRRHVYVLQYLFT